MAAAAAAAAATASRLNLSIDDMESDDGLSNPSSLRDRLYAVARKGFHRTVVLTVLEHVAVVLLWTAPHGLSLSAAARDELSRYAFDTSVGDVVGVHLLITAFGTFTTSLLPLPVPHVATAVVLLLLTCTFDAVKSAFLHPGAGSLTALPPLLFALALIRGAALVYMQHRAVEALQGSTSAALYAPLHGRAADKGDDVEVGTAEAAGKKPKLSLWQLLVVLRPFFWPDAGTDGALLNRVRACSTWAFVAASKGCSIAAPLFLAGATNRLARGDLSGAVVQAGVYAALVWASKIFKECQSLVYLKVKQQGYIQIAERTFAHLHALSLEWHLKKRLGNTVRSVDRGNDAANTLVTYGFLYLVPSIIETVAVCIVFWVKYQQWELSLLLFGGVAVYSFVTVTITLWRKKFRDATNRHDNDFHDKATDSLINYETVKYFCQEEREVQRYKESVARYQTYDVKTQASLSLLNSLQQSIIQLSSFGAMAIAAHAVVHEEMDIGDFVAVNAYVLSCFAPLSFLGSVYNALVRAFVDLRNLMELLAELPDVVDPPGAQPLPPPPLYMPRGRTGVEVEFRDVWFHYPAQDPAGGLQAVSFTVPPGTTTAIVGPTGAGKSSIGRLLFRFYDPQRGGVFLNGVNIRTVTQRSVRGTIGVVPQDTVLFHQDLRYNITYARPDASEAEVNAAADAAQIRTFIESLPEGWGTVVGERGLKLSGGEKQRVAIARAILKNPPVVLLDEATAALDVTTEAAIQQQLTSLGRNRTVLVIAHRLTTIRDADQIIVLRAGRIAEKGSHDELMAADGVYASMWRSQLKEKDLIEAGMADAAAGEGAFDGDAESKYEG